MQSRRQLWIQVANWMMKVPKSIPKGPAEFIKDVLLPPSKNSKSCCYLASQPIHFLARVHLPVSRSNGIGCIVWAGNVTDDDQPSPDAVHHERISLSSGVPFRNQSIVNIHYCKRELHKDEKSARHVFFVR